MGKWVGLGMRLKQAIKEAGFINDRGEADVQRFAIANGWAPNYVYRWINEDNTPDPDNIKKLAAATKVAPAWLLVGDDVPKFPPKRPRKALACLIAALGLTTIGGVRVAHATRPDTPSVVQGVHRSHILSSAVVFLYRRWGLHKAAHTCNAFLGVFPDLTVRFSEA